MREREGSYLRNFTIWAIIIGGHVLLLALTWRIDRQPAQTTESDPEGGVLLLLQVPPPPVEEPPARKQAPQRSAILRARKPSESSTSTTVPVEPPAANRAIDWYREAEEAARATIANGAQPGPRAVGEHPTSPYRKCRRRESSFEWDPEPEKVGIAGGLPFVRLGERCVVGLGFFGCAIGKLPEPNAALFDDMHDPNQPRSSLPDIDECAP